MKNFFLKFFQENPNHNEDNMDIYEEEIEAKLEQATGLMTSVMLDIIIMSLKQIKTGTWIFQEPEEDILEPDF